MNLSQRFNTHSPTAIKITRSLKVKTLANIRPKWWSNTTQSNQSQPEPFKRVAGRRKKKIYKIERQGRKVIAVEDVP